MTSGRPRTKHTEGPGSRPTARKCRLCFSEYDEKVNSYNSGLPDLCFKYLHSSLTQELSILSDDHPFCPRCSVAGKEIITLSEQMEILQKSLSELVFMFSLEVLHRRGKTLKIEKNPLKKLIEFDISALPNNESWNMISPQNFDASVSSPEDFHQNIPGNIYNENVGQIPVPETLDHQGSNENSIGEIKITIANDFEIGCGKVADCEEALSNTNPGLLNENGQLTIDEDINKNEVETIESISLVSPPDSHLINQENLYIQNAEDQIIFSDPTDHQSSNDITIDDIKYETIVCVSEVWNEEDTNSEERGTTLESPFLNDRDLLTDTEMSFKSKNAHENGGNSTLSNNRLLGPILKLQKLQILNEGKEIVAECIDNFMFNNDQLRISRRTVWTKSDSGSSFRLRQQNSELSNEEGGGQPNSLHCNPIPMQATIITSLANDKYIPTASYGQTSEKNETAGTSNEDIAEKSYKRSLYKKTLKRIVEKRYQCSICQKSFISNNSLYNHRRNYHSEKEIFKCTYCPKRFAYKHLLTSHVRNHTGEKPFSCDKCDYSTAWRQDLTQHKIKYHEDGSSTHWKRKIFQCTYCPRRFTKNVELVRHVRTHTGEKPFSCDQCDFSCALNRSLKDHQNRRHGNAHFNHWKGSKFQCTYCPKRCVTNLELVRHVRTHTGEKPFSCDQCDYTSALNADLKNHKNRRHGRAGLHFKCTACGCNYKFLKDAKQHFRRVHFALDLSDDGVIEFKG